MINFKNYVSYKPSRHTVLMLGSAIMLLTATGCQLAENYTKADRSGNMEIQDYRDALSARELPTKQNVSADPTIPQLQPYIADAPIERSRTMPMVSIAINQSIPLRDALFELAKQADYDLQLDPRIQGSIIYTARNRPLDEVIDQISNIAGLRSEFIGNSVKIELDNPYSKTYKIDFLPFTRSSQSSINTNLSVSGSGADTGSSTASGSNFSVESKAESDFWKDIETNLKQIIESNQASGVLKTASDPALSLSSAASGATASTSPPLPPLDPAALAPEAGDEQGVSFNNVFTGGQQVPSGNSATPAASGSENTGTETTAPDAAAPAAPSTPAAAETVLQVESLPTTSSTAEASETIASTISINKTAGIINVFAPQSVHEKVADYLSQVKKATTQQVLIEAKVLEVELIDEYANGIDWSVISRNVGGLDFVGFSGARGLAEEAAEGGLIINDGGNGVNAVIEALAKFGTVKALASPRVTVLNNQAALLNVANNRVFFEIEIEEEEGTDANPGGKTTVTSTAKTVPEGVLINVLPSIDSANNSIMMQVRPSISKIVDEVADPGVAFVTANNNNSGDDNLQSLIPVVSVKEIDTVVQMKSGQAIVMGGLMEDSTTGTQRGLPVAAEVPMLGNLFKTQDNRIKKSEFVIFLQTTILGNPSDSIDNTDRDLYRTFGQDRRPIKM
jgi:MSHA biogenesis protein MshL